jgi:hypothetical protein
MLTKTGSSTRAGPSQRTVVGISLTERASTALAPAHRAAGDETHPLGADRAALADVAYRRRLALETVDAGRVELHDDGARRHRARELVDHRQETLGRGRLRGHDHDVHRAGARPRLLAHGRARTPQVPQLVLDALHHLARR